MTPTFDSKADAVRQATEDAKSVLSKHWAGVPMPVDPVQIAEALGIEVYQRVIPSSDIAGALRKRPGERPQIFIEASDHPNRRRFTCAHEIGHYWRIRDQAEIERIDLRSTLSAMGVDLEEVYANAFAAQLLMPEDVVRAVWEQLGKAQIDVEERQRLLALTCEVSRDAMGYRLKNLGLVP